MGKDKKYLVAAIYGSPRLDGNTAILMNRFLEGVSHKAEKVKRDIRMEKIEASRLKISPCRECGNCSRTGECIIDDDMQHIFNILIDADFIAVSSPVFFTTVSGYLKALIDRCQRFWVLKYERQENIIKKSRNGIFIGASGSGSGTIFDCPKKVIRSFFDVLFVDYKAEFLYKSTDSRGDILKNKQALEAVYDFGNNIDME
jgi:multimeric flavodoxin WrbA